MDIRLIVIALLVGILLPLLTRRPRKTRSAIAPPVHSWRHRVALRQDEYPFEPRRNLLTRSERAFYRTLDEAFGGEYLIAMSVRLADLIRCSPTAWRNGHGPLISAKQIDFVLCEPETTRIVAAIELDDPTHERRDRQERDRFLDRAMDAAGVPLLRVRTAANYNAGEIRQAVEHVVARQAKRAKAA